MYAIAESLIYSKPMIDYSSRNRRMYWILHQLIEQLMGTEEKSFTFTMSLSPIREFFVIFKFHLDICNMFFKVHLYPVIFLHYEYKQFETYSACMQQQLYIILLQFQAQGSGNAPFINIDGFSAKQ